MEDLLELIKGLELRENEFPTTVLWCNAKKISDSAQVKKLPNTFERSPTESDFLENVAVIEKNISCLQHLLTRMLTLNMFEHTNTLDSHIKSFIVSSLIVCGEQSSKEVWTSNVSVQIAKDIHVQLCQLFHVDIENMFIEFESKWNMNISRLLLSTLKTKLQRQVWKQYPATFKCYRWILFNIKNLQVSENIEDILPPTLVAIDDHEINNQVLAIGCLSHIIENMTRTGLCSLGYDDLIYNALEHLLYVKEPEVIIPLIPCVTQFLHKVEKGYTRKEDYLQFTRYDKALKIILNNMEMEQYLSIRKAYIGVLALYLHSMSLPMLRWSNQLLRVFEDYLFVDDGSGGTSTKKALEALKVFILHTWPVIPDKMDKLLGLLLKLLIEMTDTDSSREISNEILEEILSLIEDCLELVIKTSSSKAKELCAGMEETFINEKFNKVINKVLLY